MKNFLLFLFILVSIKAYSQEEDLNSFISKFNIGQSMSIIGQSYNLDNGRYNSDEDYISFVVIPLKNKTIFGVDVKGITLYFKKDKLFKLAYIIDRNKAVEAVVMMMAKFSKYSTKSLRGFPYYKGDIANLYTLQLDDEFQLICISNNKIVPIDFEFE